MHIIVSTEEERQAARKVMKAFDSLLCALPTYRGDFIEPRTLQEHIIMYALFDMPVRVNPDVAEPLQEQYPLYTEDWEDDDTSEPEDFGS